MNQASELHHQEIWNLYVLLRMLSPSLVTECSQIHDYFVTQQSLYFPSISLSLKCFRGN